MSMQAGIWNLSGRPVDSGDLIRLSGLGEPSKFDEIYRWSAGPVAMVYLPFYTTRESRLEKQPFVTRRGSVLTFEGRLDNRDDLLRLLRDDVDQGQNDSAVVAAALDRWSTDAFQQLIGDWAVAVWNPSEQQLILAADYMAVCHVFYGRIGDLISWSTDLDALVRLCDHGLHIDDEFVAGYLVRECEGHVTPYKEIRQVAGGTYVRLETGRQEARRYWYPNAKSQIRYKSDPEYEEHFRHVFRQAVRRRLHSDRPIVAELSGGLDSSAMVCMADDIISSGEVATRLDTLSYFDKSEPGGDDHRYFMVVEEKRGRQGHHVDTGTLSLMSRVSCPEFPPAFPGFVGLGVEIERERASIMSKGGYRVVLSGIAGDELLGGVPNPVPRLADLILQLRPVTLARELAKWSLVKRRPWISLLADALKELLNVPVFSLFRTGEIVEPWIDEQFVKRHTHSQGLIGADKVIGFSLPSFRALASTVMAISQSMAKRECSAVAHEEVRYPYLDQPLVEFVLSIPPTQLLRPGERRSLMRRALRGIVPQEVLTRRTKQVSARTPLLALANSFGDLQSLFDDPVSARLGYIKTAGVQDVLRAVQMGKPVHLQHLFRAISLEIWLRGVTSRHIVTDESGSASFATTAAWTLN